MASFCPLVGSGGILSDLPPFAWWLNLQARINRRRRGLAKPSALSRPLPAPQWHPDAYHQPGEVE